MKIIDRYLWLNLSIGILLTWCSLALLISVIDLFSDINQVHQYPDYQLKDALLVALLNLPQHLYELFPYSALIGGLVSLSRLSVSSEITAMRAGGIALQRIIISIVALGVTLGVMASALGDWVMPRSSLYAQQHQMEKQGKRNTLSNQSTWLKHNHHIIHLQYARSADHVEGIQLFAVDFNERKLKQYTQAQLARYQAGQWVLFNATQRSNIMIACSFLTYSQLIF